MIDRGNDQDPPIRLPGLAGNTLAFVCRFFYRTMNNRPESLSVLEHRDGVIVEVRVQPAARADRIGGVHDGALKISVIQAAEGGKANKEVLRMLARKLRCSPTCVSIRSGATARRKRILIEGMTREDVLKRLTARRETT